MARGNQKIRDSRVVKTQRPGGSARETSKPLTGSSRDLGAQARTQRSATFSRTPDTRVVRSTSRGSSTRLKATPGGNLKVKAKGSAPTGKRGGR